MKYKDYTVASFLKDEYFRNWVKFPDEESDFFWNSWLNNHPEKASDVFKAKEIILSVEFSEADNHLPTQEEFNETFQRILASHSKIDAKKENRRSGRVYRRRFLSVAATVIVLIVSGALLFYPKGQEQKFQVEEFAAVTKENPKGQRSLVTLGDGTLVHLNAGSKLTFPRRFRDNNREVSLQGEAFFEVTKDESKPFIITSGEIKTTVLGTSFNVKAFPEKNKTLIAVVSGKVVVENMAFENNTVELAADEMIIVDKKEVTMNKVEFHYNEEIGWKDGILVFKNGDIQDVKEKLQNWYGVEIIVEDGAEVESSFNGEFENNSLEYVLKAMAYSCDLKYSIDNKLITISK